MPCRSRKSTKRRRRNPVATTEGAEAASVETAAMPHNDDRASEAVNKYGHRLWTVVDLPGGQVYWYRY